jgi:hypothetical protein
MCTVLAILVGLCGCEGSIDPYPDKWPPIKSEGLFTCPKLSGTYNYLGTRDEHAFNPSLSSLLLGFPHERRATHVGIDVGTNGTKISVWNGESLINQGFVADFHCFNGTLYTKTRDRRPSNADIAKAADGSIVALLHHEEWWFLAIVPLRHKAGAWFRWRERQASAQKD